jgi:hypothetical protein
MTFGNDMNFSFFKPAPPPETPPPILTALQDAEVLADYVSSEAIPDTSQHVLTIARSRELYHTTGLFGAQQHEFYTAYAALAHAIQPVTVASLYDCLDKYGPPRRDWLGRPKCPQSRARIAAQKQRFWAFVALLLLLVVQSYVLVGQSLLQAISKLPDDYVKNLILVQKRFERELGRIENQVTNAPFESLRIPFLPSTNAPAPASDPKTDDVEKRLLNSRIQDFKRRQVAEMLVAWGRPAAVFANILTLQKFSWKEFIENSDLETLENEDVDQTIVKTGRVIDVLQQVLLPICYGWVGAWAYVLRRLGREAAERTYREDNKIAYSLRVWLGVVAGLAIGWFLRPEKVEVGSATSISPFALAFVAGYSVDLLFTAMDRLVLAFSGTPAGGAPSAQQTLLVRAQMPTVQVPVAHGAVQQQQPAQHQPAQQQPLDPNKKS